MLLRSENTCFEVGFNIKELNVTNECKGLQLELKDKLSTFGPSILQVHALPVDTIVCKRISSVHLSPVQLFFINHLDRLQYGRQSDTSTWTSGQDPLYTRSPSSRFQEAINQCSRWAAAVFTLSYA